MSLFILSKVRKILLREKNHIHLKKVSFDIRLIILQLFLLQPTLHQPIPQQKYSSHSLQSRHSTPSNNTWNINKNGESVALQESIPPFAINQTRIRTHPFSTRPPPIRHIRSFFPPFPEACKGGWNRQRWRVNSKQRVATTLRKQKDLVIDYRKNSLSSTCPCSHVYIYIQY